jgi:hypothetical protein
VALSVIGNMYEQSAEGCRHLLATDGPRLAKPSAENVAEC